MLRDMTCRNDYGAGLGPIFFKLDGAHRVGFTDCNLLRSPAYLCAKH
jgi:hypothetical protein